MAIRGVVVVALVLLAGCRVSGVEQAADTVVFEGRTAKANPAGTPVTATRTDELLVGSDTKDDTKMPVVVTWTVAPDAEGCARVQSVKLARKGGPTTSELYDVKLRDDLMKECGSRDIVGPKFDMVSVSYCWRWNGAVNKDPCAYSGGFMISGDKEQVEGSVERPKP
jgi:hypothetical protein